MTFIRAVPGPSRLALPSTGRTASRSLSRSAPLAAKGASEALSKNLAEASSENASDSWLNGPGGRQFKWASKGSKAAWLGDSVPYASNPSFRPLPPLSNQTQNNIAKALNRGDKTVGQIAEEFHVSKARIEAIRKLKEVEAEFKRQSLPLQTAFLNGMEPLLGVSSPSTKSRQSRESQWSPHQSVAVEREEEDRLDAGIGAHGAFAARTVDSEVKDGIERVAFEYRDEEAMLAERRAEARARGAKDVSNEAEAKVAEQDAAPQTPGHEHEQEQTKPEKRVGKAKAKLVPSASGRAGYRFIDTSSQAGSRAKKQ